MTEFRVNRRRLLQASGAGFLGAVGLGQFPAASAAAEAAWTFETGGEVTASPTVVDGTVYIGSRDSYIYALDGASGDELWSVDTGGPVDASPQVVDGLVVAGSEAGTYALEAATGETRWTVEGEVEASPTVVGGRAVVPRPGRLDALDIGTGTRLWSFDIQAGGSQEFSAPTVVDISCEAGGASDGGTVYVGVSGFGRGNNLGVYALTAGRGEKLWSFAPEFRFQAPTVAEGVVYVGREELTDGTVHALDATDGQELWQFDTGRGIQSVPTVSGETVYVGNREGTLYALSAGDGDELWAVDIDAEFSSPTVADGTVFVGSTDPVSGALYALSAEDGENRQRFEVGRAVRSSPTVVDGTVYVGSADGTVYAFDADVAGSSHGSRVRRGTLGHHDEWADQAPTAVFEPGDTNPTTGEEVTFDATRSTGDIASYEWDLTGEEDIDTTGPTVSHTFETAGEYAVSLTVTDTDGETDTRSRYVSVHPPVRWQRSLDAPVVASPTVVDGSGFAEGSSNASDGGTVYVGDTDGIVYALDAETNTKHWEYDTGELLEAAPTVVDGTVYVVGGGTVHALDGDTGDRRWRAGVDDARASPTVADGTVFVGTGDGYLYALSAADGTVLWRFDAGDQVTSSPTVAGGAVLFGTFEGHVYALDRDGGTQLWSVDTDDPVTSSPTVADGRVFVGTSGASFSEGRLYALDVTSGDELWAVGTDAAINASPTVAGNAVHVASERTMYTLSTTGGDELWTASIGPRAVSSPTVADGVVFGGNDAGELYGLDAETGERRWTLETGEPIQSSPTVVDGVVYVGAGSRFFGRGSEGSVYALDGNVEGNSRDTRVQLGTLGHHDEWADQAPTAMFTVEPDDPDAGEEVTFDATMTTGEIDSYEWDLTGDGSIDTAGSVVSRTFTESGGHELRLTVTDTDGETATARRRISLPAPLDWTFETGDAVESSPTVVDISGEAGGSSDCSDGRTVYVGSSDGHVYALDAADGTADWEYRTDWEVNASPTVVDGTVFVSAGAIPFVGATGEGAVYALDAETGDLRWQVDVPAARSSPTVVGRTLFVGDLEGRVHALTAATGESLWTFDTGAGIRSSPTVVDGRVYLGNADGNVYALSTTGDELWVVETDDGVRSSPTVADGRVFVGSRDGRLYGLDAADGEELWTFDTDEWIFSSPTAFEGTVYVGAGDNRVHALSAADGDRLWSFEAGGAVNSSPTVAGASGEAGGTSDGATVYVGNFDGTVYALDGDTGRELWRFEVEEDPTADPFETGNSVFSSPTAFEGTIYVGSDNGHVYALEAGSDRTSEGSRVRLGTLGHHGDWQGADQVLDFPEAGNGRNGDGDGNGNGNGDGDRGTDETEGDDGFGPGMGPGVALTSLASVGYLLKRRLGDGTDE